MIIAIASQKGGVGKTSSSISLAAGLARKGKKVLLIDIDSQANSSKVLLPDYQQRHGSRMSWIRSRTTMTS
jgi:chromosome partitioning protein